MFSFRLIESRYLLHWNICIWILPTQGYDQSTRAAGSNTSLRYIASLFYFTITVLLFTYSYIMGS